MSHTFPAEFGYEKGVRMVAPEQLENIIQILLGWRYSDADLQAILGGNLMRLAREVWRPA
jgi:membrane dipeptidase